MGSRALTSHIIVPAMDWDGERAFNVYRQDLQQTRAVAEPETELHTSSAVGEQSLVVPSAPSVAYLSINGK